jgi:beta-xylosidase
VQNDLQLPATPQAKALFEEFWPLYNRLNLLTKHVGFGYSNGLPSPGTQLDLDSALYAVGQPVFWTEGNLLSPNPNTGWYYIGNAMANGKVFVGYPILVK